MPTAKVTAKGQITLPKEIRTALGVELGDRVQFFVRADGVVELRPRTRDLLSLAGMLEPRRSSVSLEDMDAAVEAMFAADREDDR